MECGHCGKTLQRKRYNGRLEDMGVFKRRKYCDAICSGQKRRLKIPTRSAVQKRIAGMKKSFCEHCKTSENLCVHHIDRDWRNNSEENLQTLCSSCHTSLHHRNGDIVTLVQKPPCYICGTPSYRKSLCCTHLTRYKKYGDPLIVNGKRVSC